MRIVYVQAGGIQVGSSPGSIASYHGAAGETANVPADVAALLVGLGFARLADEPASKPAPRRRAAGR